ncbi:hypothetical protein ACFWUZ_09775 [Streptomyces sp. NPDC058646]|uniref:hypothetical protein n=1 Tax=Streptomyces sp. NPDC058646 TaxID=3346574 RepID=UPI003667AA41
MPFAEDEIRWDHACGPGPDGRRRGWFAVHLQSEALRPLGLHPGRPTAEVTGPAPPGWWHAEAERHARSPAPAQRRGHRSDAR